MYSVIVRATGPFLHVHLAPLPPVGSWRFPFVRARHAATGTAAASAVVLIGMRRTAGGHGGDVGEHQWRWWRRRDGQRRQQRLAHGHRGQSDRTDGQGHWSRRVHRSGAVQRGRRERRVQYALANVHAAPALVVQRARQVRVHLLDRRQHHLCVTTNTPPQTLPNYFYNRFRFCLTSLTRARAKRAKMSGFFFFCYPRTPRGRYIINRYLRSLSFYYVVLRPLKTREIDGNKYLHVCIHTHTHIFRRKSFKLINYKLKDFNLI